LPHEILPFLARDCLVYGVLPPMSNAIRLSISDSGWPSGFLTGATRLHQEPAPLARPDVLRRRLRLCTRSARRRVNRACGPCDAAIRCQRDLGKQWQSHTEERHPLIGRSGRRLTIGPGHARAPLAAAPHLVGDIGAVVVRGPDCSRNDRISSRVPPRSSWAWSPRLRSCGRTSRSG